MIVNVRKVLVIFIFLLTHSVVYANETSPDWEITLGTPHSSINFLSANFLDPFGLGVGGSLGKFFTPKLEGIIGLDFWTQNYQSSGVDSNTTVYSIHPGLAYNFSKNIKKLLGASSRYVD